LRQRFAPSPTGDLHLGGAYIALAAWLRARNAGDAFVVRDEDLDRPRVVPGAIDRILDDLSWLGLDWDEGPRVGGPHAPYSQSQRDHLYEEAIRALGDRVYPCTCTRAEIASSAPHAAEVRYPGTCRDPKNRKAGRAASLRLWVPEGVVRFVDEIHGPQEQDVAAVVGDFVLRRADGVASYQLAVVVDDIAMNIGEIVRGDDLLSSTARQIVLIELLGAKPPRWVHLPLVLGPDGSRLAKRHQSQWMGSTVRELREAGVSASEIVTELASALGISRGIAPREMVGGGVPRRIRPWTVPSLWVTPRSQ
jgi:glutamyl-tRNA synthetase